MQHSAQRQMQKAQGGQDDCTLSPAVQLPNWLPHAFRLHLEHTEAGQSIRALARQDGLNASTVLRHVRRCEMRRDDPLIDEALCKFRHGPRRDSPASPEDIIITAQFPALALTRPNLHKQRRAFCAVWPKRGRFWPLPLRWKRPP